MMPIAKGSAPRELTNDVRRICSTPDTTLNWSQVAKLEKDATLRSLLSE